MTEIILRLPENLWEFLKPILHPYVITREHLEFNEPIDMDAIHKLPCGTRICNILTDDRWGTQSGKILTVSDLRRVTYHEFSKHPNAGKKSWDVLQEYINTLNDNNGNRT